MKTWVKAIEPGLGLISTHRYALLVLFLFFKLAVAATNGIWYEDFWEHSAVVHALMQSSTNPSHPILALHAPHAFMSPYHWVVAQVAVLTGLSSIDALAIAGLVNVILLFAGLRLYVGQLAPRHADAASFYGLLFILFLWGSKPWGFSGFLHNQLLADVLPYASSFATALSLLGLALGLSDGAHTSIARHALLAMICTITLLSHPLTFVFLASGLVCQALTRDHRLTRLGVIGLSLVVAGLLALCWPYYPILTLLTGAGDVYHASNQSMYHDVLTRVWPILALSPVLFLLRREASTRGVILHIVVLICIYVFGWVTGKYAYGRDISFIAILVQLLIGIQCAAFEQQQSSTRPTTTFVYRIVLFFTLVGLAAGSWLYPTVTRALTLANSLVIGRSISNQHTYGQLNFLRRYLNAEQVVLSDLETSWLIPSFGGKVIAALHDQAFVADDEERRNALIAFFNADTDAAARVRFLNQYQPRFLLIDKHRNIDAQALLASIEPSFNLTRVYENERYALWSIH